MSSDKRNEIIITGELLPGWNNESDCPQTQNEWKRDISGLLLRLRINNKLVTPGDNETYKVTSSGYVWTEARRMVFSTALALYNKAKKIKSEEILFRQKKNGELLTRIEVVSNFKTNSTPASSGDLFGG